MHGQVAKIICDQYARGFEVKISGKGRQNCSTDRYALMRGSKKGKNRFFPPNFWSGLGSVGVIDLFEGPGIVGEVLGAPWGVSRGPMCRYWPEIPALDYNVNG